MEENLSKKEKRKARRDNKKWRRKVCKSTLVFSVLRAPFTLLGFFLGGLIPIGLARYTSSTTLLLIGSALGVFVYKQVTNFGKNQYQSAQIAILTVGLKRHRLVPNPYKNGLKMVKFYFEASAVTTVLMNIVKYSYNKVFHRVSFKEAQHEEGSNLLEDIKAMIVVTICTLIPYLGYCIMSHMVYHAEVTRMRAVCDAVEGFFRNLKKMVPRMLRIAIPNFIKLSFNIIISGVVFYFIFKANPDNNMVGTLYSFMKANGEISQEYDAKNMEDMLFTVVGLCAAAFAFALNLLTQADSMYSTIERYYEVIEQNPSKGVIYRKFQKMDKDAVTLGGDMDSTASADSTDSTDSTTNEDEVSQDDINEILS